MARPSRELLKSWATLLAATAVLTTLMRLAHMPATFMLGPLLAGIATALVAPGAKLPPGATVAAQGVLGSVIAQTLAPGLLLDLAPRWPLLLGVNAVMVGGIAGIGLIITRRQWLPGTAGIWGVSPGAASAMVMLADEYGSDKRLVALMQYLRILCAAVTVIAVGSLFGHRHPPTAVALPGASNDWLAPVDPVGLAVVAGLSLAALVVAVRLHKPALAIFAPIILGVLIQIPGWAAPRVPPLAAAAAFSVIGWHVGLTFTRASLLHSARMLPRIFAMIASVLALCGVLALGLAEIADVSLLTAYMALNPGGIDAVLILAASIDVDLPLILAIQISRLLLVIALLPALSRMVADRHLRSARDELASDASDRLAKDVDTVL